MQCMSADLFLSADPQHSLLYCYFTRRVGNDSAILTSLTFRGWVELISLSFYFSLKRRNQTFSGENIVLEASNI